MACSCPVSYSPRHYQNATTSQELPGSPFLATAALGPRSAKHQCRGVHTTVSARLYMQGQQVLASLPLQFMVSALPRAHPNVNFMDTSINLVAFPCPWAI